MHNQAMSELEAIEHNTGNKPEFPPNWPVSPVNGQPVPRGRAKGTPNRSTGMAREAIANFVEGNVGRLNGWLDNIAERSPELAFKLFMEVVEYHIPKLQRAEITGKDGKDLIPESIALNFKRVPDAD